MKKQINFPKPGLQYLMSMEFKCKESYDIGKKCVQTMEAGKVSGGINGTFKEGGGNWLTKCEDGKVQLDSRYVIETNEKEILPFDVNGFILPDGTAKLRLFSKAGTKKYEWLNHVVVIAVGSVLNDEYKLDVYTFADADVAGERAYFDLPQLEHLYYVQVDVGEFMRAGKLPEGAYMVIPITGGRFEGEKLNGNVEYVGADWNFLNQGMPVTSHASTRYLLHTDDDAYISLFTDAKMKMGAAGMMAMIKGKPDPLKTYFKQHLMFETGDARYAWINDELCVATVSNTMDGKVCYDAYRII